MGIILGIPEPSVHDEFSYLLAADTFSQGRLTNPTHPMWVHFETMHVNHEPSYMSRYMPAQGLVLAFGKVFWGHPIFGVWLAMSLMCAAICWMLQAWLPPRWALFGGILTMIHPHLGVASYWAQSYWGGAVPALGGALLLGGLRHLTCKPRAIYAATAGAGLAILANSRPYEGLILSLPVAIGLLVWLSGKQRPPFAVTVQKILFPLSVVGVMTLAGMAYYNYRNTGSIVRLQYLIHEQTYSMSTLFIWQQAPPAPTFRHAIIRDFHADYELPVYLEKHSLKGFIKVNFAGLTMYMLLAGSVFAIPLVGSARQLLVWSWNHRWGRFALSTYAFFVLGMMIETYMSLHYWAPITALNYFFIVQGIRLWRARSPRMGRIVLYAVPLLALAVLGINTFHAVNARDELAPHLQRARLLKELNQTKDRHLIVVAYGPKHSYDREWVYNDADIDGSKVVWARAMDLKENCNLIAYFKDRVIWSLEIDRDDAPIELKPFSRQSCG